MFPVFQSTTATKARRSATNSSSKPAPAKATPPLRRNLRRHRAHKRPANPAGPEWQQLPMLSKTPRLNGGGRNRQQRQPQKRRPPAPPSSCAPLALASLAANLFHPQRPLVARALLKQMPRQQRRGAKHKRRMSENKKQCPRQLRPRAPPAFCAAEAAPSSASHQASRGE